MSMVKVWNLTDAEGPGQLRMVLGRSVKPGRAVHVEEARLERAHKVHKDVDAKLLSIGSRPPAWYLAKKKPPRAKADARLVGPDGRVDPSEPQVVVAKGHVRLPAEAIAADSAEAVEEAKVEEEATPVYTKAAEETAEEAAEETAEETSKDDDNSSWKSRRRKRGK